MDLPGIGNCRDGGGSDWSCLAASGASEAVDAGVVSAVCGGGLWGDWKRVRVAAGLVDAGGLGAAVWLVIVVAGHAGAYGGIWIGCLQARSQTAWGCSDEVNLDYWGRVSGD